MRTRILAMFVLVMTLVNFASALDVYNRGPTDYHNPAYPSNLWTNAWNWIQWPPPDYIAKEGVATAADRVLINCGPDYPILIDDTCTGGTNAAVCYRLNVGFWGTGAKAGPCTLNMTGGTLTTTDRVGIGSGTGDVGYFNVSGGTISIGGLFAVGGYDGSNGGNGFLNMSGGTINVATVLTTANFEVGNRPGYGTVNLSGGTITAPNLLMTARGSLIISGTGRVVLSGDKTATINNTYIANGWIRGQAQYMTSGPYAGKTVISAPPEATAHNPAPTSGAVKISPDNVTLGWEAGVGAVSHDVYFGTTLADVNSTTHVVGDLNRNGIVDWNDVLMLSQYWLTNPAGSQPYRGVNTDSSVDFTDYALLSQNWLSLAGPTAKGNLTSTSYIAGLLESNMTYYWRIDEINGPNTVKGGVWSFLTDQVGKAFNPIPESGASNVATDANLSWTAGRGATSHEVYFDTANPPVSHSNQTLAMFDPGTLLQGVTYYWRVDEVNDSGLVQGDVWNFTTQGITMLKGPYLVYPGNNAQMTVLWQLDRTADCNVAWGTDTTYSTGIAATTEYGTDHQHNYTISGLVPGTKYYYRVVAGNNTYGGSFRSAPANDANSIKFLCYGDTRSNSDYQDMVCTDIITKYTAEPDCQTMVLHTGDWIYSDTEQYWTSDFFSRTFAHNLTMQANMPIQGCVGNHEAYPAGSLLYRKYWPYPYVNSRFYWSFDYGPAHIAVVDQYDPAGYAPGSPQYQWLENDLQTTTKRWKFIMLHEPGWSAAGSNANNVYVQSNIQPLCESKGVQIVFSGHNHWYSRAVVSGVQHLTIGTAGGPPSTPLDGNPNVVFKNRGYGYCLINIEGNTLTGTMYTSLGNIVIETFTLALP